MFSKVLADLSDISVGSNATFATSNDLYAGSNTTPVGICIEGVEFKGEYAYSNVYATVPCGIMAEPNGVCVGINAVYAGSNNICASSGIMPIFKF